MKTGNLVVVLPQLGSAQRKQIADAAEAKGFHVTFFESTAESLPSLEDAEIILGQDAALAKKAPKLEWICTPSAGVNQFVGKDIFASPDAVLTNSSGAYGVTIAEHTIMMLLSLFRRRLDYDAIVSRREWKRDLSIRSIRDGCFVLAGTGDIGQEVAIRLRAFGPRSVIGVNRGGKNPQGLFDRVVPISEWESVLPEADALILSLPGTPETFRLLGEKQLRLLKDGASIINVGRGTVVNQETLFNELHAGRLTAALDVFESEPLPKDDPMWECPNLILTPHIAGNMTLPWTVQRIVDLFLEDLEHYAKGEPLCRKVSLEKGY